MSDFCELCFARYFCPYLTLKEKKELMLERHNQIIEKAIDLCGKLPKCEVVFSSRLTCRLGYWQQVGSKHKIVYSTKYMESSNFVESYINVIPHEIAHFVAKVKLIGKNHDDGWRNLCLDLGGNGTTCFDESRKKYSSKCVCKVNKRV